MAIIRNRTQSAYDLLSAQSIGAASDQVATGIKYLKSRRGKVIMMVNTFPFCEESKLRDKVIWRCTSKKTNCKARIHMLGANVVAVKGMHNHPPRAPTS
ncbi:unnamed protein product, partial [Iphiclides podalirius]